MVRLLLFSFFASVFAVSLCASAQQGPTTIRLFTLSSNNVLDTIPKYNETVKLLKPDDVLIFPNGKSFVLGEKLGHGQTTMVWALKENENLALRIPLLNLHAEFINFSIDGSAELERAGVPHVKMYDFEPYQYVVVERVRNFVNFEDFIEEYSAMYTRRERSRNIPLEQMRQDFISFAAKTALFRKIGDAHVQNLVYDLDNRLWLLMDWSDSHRVAYSTRKPLVFLSARSFIEDLLREYGEFDGVKFSPDGYRQKWMVDFHRDIRTEVESARKAMHGRFLCEDIFDVGFAGNIISNIVRPR